MVNQYQTLERAPDAVHSNEIEYALGKEPIMLTWICYTNNMVSRNFVLFTDVKPWALQSFLKLAPASLLDFFVRRSYSLEWV